MKHFSLLFLLCALAGCVNSEKRYYSQRDKSRVTGICVVHKKPLHTVHCYKADMAGIKLVVVYEKSTYRCQYRFPNSLPLGYSKSKFSDFGNIPETAPICTDCEDGVEACFRDSK